MTTHYVNIRLLPDPEFIPEHLMAALYTKLHRALAHMQASDIGVSFPGYSRQPRSLGQTLRLHGSEAALRKFLSTDWLHGMRDHTEPGDILPAPPGAPQRRLQRRQFQSSAERLRRRRMRRKGETEEQARAAIPDGAQRYTELPYLHLKSASTGQHFCLFLELGEPAPTPVSGSFNTYGLSSTATLPWF